MQSEEHHKLAVALAEDHAAREELDLGVVAAERHEIQARPRRATLGACIPYDAGLRPQRLDGQPQSTVEAHLARGPRELDALSEPP